MGFDGRAEDGQSGDTAHCMSLDPSPSSRGVSEFSLFFITLYTRCSFWASTCARPHQNISEHDLTYTLEEDTLSYRVTSPLPLYYRCSFLHPLQTSLINHRTL